MACPPQIQLFIQASDGMMTVDVPSDSTVGDLRQKVEAQLHTVCGVELSFAGEALDDDDASLADVNVSTESTVHAANTLSQWDLILQTWQSIIGTVAGGRLGGT